MLFLKMHLGDGLAPSRPNSRVLIDTPWLAKAAGNMSWAYLQWIWQTQKFNQLGHNMFVPGGLFNASLIILSNTKTLVIRVPSNFTLNN